MRVGKLKNGKTAGEDEITGKMIKGGGDRMVDYGDDGGRSKSGWRKLCCFS